MKQENTISFTRVLPLIITKILYKSSNICLLLLTHQAAMSGTTTIEVLFIVEYYNT